MSPTALSLKLLRQWGYLADVVERWIPHANIRRDLFGGFDLIGVDVRGKATWLIQTTTLSNLSSRVKKLRGLAVVADLIRAGIVCDAWGWQLHRGRWRVKRVRLTGDGLEPVELGSGHRGRGKRHRQPALFD